MQWYRITCKLYPRKVPSSIRKYGVMKTNLSPFPCSIEQKALTHLIQNYGCSPKGRGTSNTTICSLFQVHFHKQWRIRKSQNLTMILPTRIGHSPWCMESEPQNSLWFHWSLLAQNKQNWMKEPKNSYDIVEIKSYGILQKNHNICDAIRCQT